MHSTRRTSAHRVLYRYRGRNLRCLYSTTQSISRGNVGAAIEKLRAGVACMQPAIECNSPAGLCPQAIHAIPFQSMFDLAHRLHAARLPSRMFSNAGPITRQSSVSTKKPAFINATSCMDCTTSRKIRHSTCRQWTTCCRCTLIHISARFLQALIHACPNMDIAELWGAHDEIHACGGDLLHAWQIPLITRGFVD